MPDLTGLRSAAPQQDLLEQARRLEQAGHLAESVAAYERLLALRPELADCWYNLARLHRRLDRPEAALAAYAKALALHIDRPEEVRLNRGVIYADDLRRPPAAERELREALRLNPRYVPALLNLANLAEDRGRRAEAIEFYEQILAIDPKAHLALARLSGLKVAASPGDPLIAQLKAGLADTAASVSDRIDLAFALGKALDGCGAYDEAFAAYELANRLSRSVGGAGAVYDRARTEARFDQLIAAFTPELIGRLRTASEAAPLFICGMFRSGSTLTEQVLAAHPRVTAGGELDLLPQMVRAELSPFPERLGDVRADKLRRLSGSYLDALGKLFPSADIVTDKRPDNFLYLGLIKLLWPKARIIHTLRQPLDNCLSLYFLQLNPSMSHALELGDAGHYYRQYRRLMDHWKALFGADILDFSYDALVRSPRPNIERLLRFCELQWDEACLDFHRQDNAVKTASVWQVREPLYQHSSERWRHYERHLSTLKAELAGVAV